MASPAVFVNGVLNISAISGSKTCCLALIYTKAVWMDLRSGRIQIPNLSVLRDTALSPCVGRHTICWVKVLIQISGLMSLMDIGLNMLPLLGYTPLLVTLDVCFGSSCLKILSRSCSRGDVRSWSPEVLKLLTSLLSRSSPR